MNVFRLVSSDFTLKFAFIMGALANTDPQYCKLRVR